MSNGWSKRFAYYGCGSKVTTSAFLDSTVAQVREKEQVLKQFSVVSLSICSASLNWLPWCPLDCVKSFKRLANQLGRNITVIAWVAMDLWQRKQTLSSDCALGLGSFTDINPCPQCDKYYLLYSVYNKRAFEPTSPSSQG